jgi:hypothetical protein
VVSGHSDDLSGRASRWNPERVSLALYDQHRDADRIQLGQTALRLLATGRLEREREAQHRDGAGLLDRAAATRPPMDLPPTITGRFSSRSARRLSTIAIHAASR